MFNHFHLHLLRLGIIFSEFPILLDKIFKKLLQHTKPSFTSLWSRKNVPNSFCLSQFFLFIWLPTKDNMTLNLSHELSTIQEK